MQVANGMSQIGGYHCFISISARQLQRYVRQRGDWSIARRDASAHRTKDVTSFLAPGRHADLERIAGSARGAPTERFPRDPWTAAHMGWREQSTKHPGPAVPTRAVCSVIRADRGAA
jgi:hypothetical protein